MATMSNEPRADQPPEGLLLEQARDRLGISQNEASRQAGISGTRWRQIVYEKAAEMTSPRGVKTLARMARVIGVQHEHLDDVGRGDVASELRAMLAEEQLAAHEAPTPEKLAAELARLRADHAELRREFEELQGRDRKHGIG
jgi:transcriptional regulator with XRE-family HTH domain